MKAQLFRAYCQLVLLTLLIVSSSFSPVARANDPEPLTSPTVEPTSQPTADAATYSARAITDEMAAEMKSSTANNGDRPAVAVKEEADEDEATSTASTTPSVSAFGEIGAQGVQGVVTLDVSVAETLKAGDTLVYKYAYQNTSGSTISGVVIEALWSNFSITPNNNWQWCDASCNVHTQSGPAVTKLTSPTDANPYPRYSVGELGPNVSGFFTIVIRTNSTIYPKSNEAITRPAGSGRLYLSSAPTTVVSEDTANALVIGPALRLTKAASSSAPIYATETAEFVLTVGNATGSGDRPDGQIRPDARPANNITVKDFFPAGSDFVSATPTPTSVDTIGKSVSWNIAGPLNPGQSVQIRVTFRKLDVAADCDKLENNNLNVTSNEYLLNNTRYTVSGSGASVPVQVTMNFKSVVATPNNTPFGSESTLTAVIRNYWNQPLTNAQLHYDIQSNATYIAGSAIPAASAAPSGSTSGGRVTWTFNMPAGSKTAPSEATFTLRIRGGYTTVVQDGTGRFQIVAPAGVPSACIMPQPLLTQFFPRLSMAKTTEITSPVVVGGVYLTQRGFEFPYTVAVQNSGSTDATGVTVTDNFPNQLDANFTYVSGSATLNGQPRAPDVLKNGFDGTMIWNNLTVPANTTIYLRYKLKVDGRDYYDYCNTASVSKDNEGVTYGYRRVCVRINPQIQVTKTADRSTANPGDEVLFTLTLKNLEATTYRVGLFDLLNNFTFVRQESGYAQPQPDTRIGNGLIWPAVDLAPGQQVTAVIRVKVPTNCVTTTYTNEGMFRNATDIVQPVPQVTASVKVSCTPEPVAAPLHFEKFTDRSIVSLKDRVGYSLRVRNPGSATVNNVVIEDLLPAGFIFDSFKDNSGVNTPPTQQTVDGRIKLSWTVPSISGDSEVQVRFYARSGDVVGAFENWLAVPQGSQCGGQCKTVNNVTYSYQTVTVHPLITAEPKITPITCAKPGDKPVYQLTIVNTNDHDYTGTNVTLKLPLGLRYLRTLNTTPTPATKYEPDGTATLAWSNLRIPAAPSNSLGTQVIFEVELQVGQVWGDLPTVIETTSPDGSIPRKDSVLNPTVPVCPASPSIAKEASRSVVRIGDEFVYQITVGNPNSSPITVSVRDQLPSNIVFVGNVTGQANVNGNVLTWSNISVPPASNGKPGSAKLAFRAKVVTGVLGTKIVNTATVTSSSVPIDTTYQSVAITIPVNVYIPQIRR